MAGLAAFYPTNDLWEAERVELIHDNNISIKIKN